MDSPRLSTKDEPFGWSDLAKRIADYLGRNGVPSPEADRLSREIIRMHADAADSLERDRLASSAMGEARTLLDTWQATRREQLLAHV